MKSGKVKWFNEQKGYGFIEQLNVDRLISGAFTRIEKHNLTKVADSLAADRMEATSVSEALSAIEKEQNHLADLHNNESHIKRSDERWISCEIAHNQRQDGDLQRLKEVANHALESGAKTQDSLLEDLRNVSDLKDAHIKIDKENEAHHINNTLRGFADDKDKATDPQIFIDIMGKEQKFLSDLHGNIKYSENRYEIADKCKFAHAQQYELDQNLAKLSEVAGYALKSGAKTEQSLIADLRNVSDLKDAYATVDKGNEAHHISSRLSGYEKDKHEAKTFSQLVDVLKKQQEYLSGLKDNLKYEHDKDLTLRITSACQSQENNTIEQLRQDAIFAHKNGILSQSAIFDHFRSGKDANELYNVIRKTCYRHHIDLINKHMDQYHHTGSIEHANQTFECPVKYLEHWRDNVDHHMIPIKQINQKIEHERDLQLQRDRGMEMHM